MNTNGIEALLNKFFEGNTSLQEEKILRDFFHGKDVPDHLRSHKSLFNYFSDEQQQKINDQDFEQLLTARLSDKTNDTPVIPKYSIRSRFIYIAGIAASILLLLGLLFTFQHDVFRKHSDRIHPGPEMAYTDAREALMPNTTLLGDANLLVLPNIDAANIAYNLLKTAAGGNIAIGPVLLGAAKPVHVLTASTTVRRIVNMTALTVADANASR